MNSLSVVGQGFVGLSIAQVFAERGLNVYAFDLAGKKAPLTNSKQFLSIRHLIETCEEDKTFTGVVFLCVPTPMIVDTGECDISIVETALKEIALVATKDIVVVCKSTMPPTSTKYFNKILEGTKVKVVHSPEFLSERTALSDMRSQDRIVIGGEEPSRGRVKMVFAEAFPNVLIVETDSTTSELVKYFTNIQLTTRIVLSCEFHEICNKLTAQGTTVNYDEVARISSFDKRLGNSHMTVPGHDGISGARGHCLPKDLSAMVYVAEKLGIVRSLMKAVKERNLSIVAPHNRDWEKMIGRGVSAKKFKVNIIKRTIDNTVRGLMSFAPAVFSNKSDNEISG